MLQYKLIDWCLTPTVAIFSYIIGLAVLFSGILNKVPKIQLIDMEQ
jgi:hypothetical protein